MFERTYIHIHSNTTVLHLY